MSTLYVSDLDGTLLNNGSYVSPRSAAIISDLTSDGALITVATARTPATVVPLMEETHTSVPYVVLTGAALFDADKMRYFCSRTISEEQCRLLDELFAEAGVNPFIYRFYGHNELEVSHSREMTERERDFYTPRSNLALKHFTFEPSASRPGLGSAILYFAIGSEAKISALAEQIDRTGVFSFSFYPDIFVPGVFQMEVFALGVSKASALLSLKEHIGADRMVVFGDNLNDLSMFEVADVAVAVANAQPRVKEAADLVIGPNYDDSVARFILHDYYTAANYR